MKIVDLRVYPVCIPLKEALITAYGKRDFAEFVLIEIETDSGLVGIGEAAAIPIYDEGDPAGEAYVLKRYLKPLLLGKDPTHIVDIHHMMDEAVRGHRYAKSAVSIALYDLLGKRAGLPVFKLLGGRGGCVPVIWLVSASQGPEAIEEASQRIKEGFKAIKVKVGKNWRQEVAFLRELRKEVGEQPEIRLDANGAWHWKEALRHIRQLESLNVSLLEQPVPAWDTEGLRKVSSQSSIPIVADECALTLHDVYALAHISAADYLNIKICRSGGIYRGIQMATVAEAAGMTVVVGSMLEYGVGTMAGAHFASLFNCNAVPAEVIGPLIAQDDVVVPPVRYECGKVVLSDAPGLGVELDKRKVHRYAKEV